MRLANLWRRTNQIIESKFDDKPTALIVHGLHKSATMFLYHFFADLAQQLNVPMHSVHDSGSFAHENLDSTSYIRCPERSFVVDDSCEKSVQQIIRLFQIRDPRDILVSEYFSLGWRHSDEHWNEEEKSRRRTIQQMSVDEYVLTEPEISKYPLEARLQAFIENYSIPCVHIVKYETLVTDFPAWLGIVFEALGISDHRFAKRLFKKYRHEFVVDQKTSGHKRNIEPGDHRKKLEQATIDQLNKRFGSFLELAGYEQLVDTRR